MRGIFKKRVTTKNVLTFPREGESASDLGQSEYEDYAVMEGVQSLLENEESALDTGRM